MAELLAVVDDNRERERAIQEIREQTRVECEQLFGAPTEFGDGERHSTEELEQRLKLMWLNSGRCIGRLFFRSLKLLDYRDAATDDEIYEGLLTHLAVAKNDPYRAIKPVASVFDSSIEIVNAELLEYAGWEENGKRIGDQKNLGLTALAESNGWRPQRDQFTILPLMWHKGDGELTVAPIPEEFNGQAIRQEISLEHPDPDKAWLKDMNLRWFWGPFISNRKGFVDGQSYTVPFSGYYEHEEIAKNVIDEPEPNGAESEPPRFGLLRQIGQRMCEGWDIDLDRSDGWKHEVATLLNTAVEHSFAKARVQTISSIKASDGFLKLMHEMANVGVSLPHDPEWLRSSMPAFQTSYYHEVYPAPHIPEPLHGPVFYHPHETPDPLARYMQAKAAERDLL